MGHCVAKELSKSRRDNVLETRRARQAHYIQWTKLKGIEDPCQDGNNANWAFVLACYAKYVASGCNCNNKSNTRSDTVKGYLEAVNDLFIARKFKPPVDLNEITNPASTIVKNLKEEEDIAKRRDPITSEIYAEIIRQAKEAEPGSEKWLLGKLANVAKNIGPRSCEYAQKKANEVEYHVYPSGNKVVKAFTREDITFLDKNSRKLDVSNPESRKLVAKVRIRWRIQKNRQNGQTVTVKREWSVEDLCGVLALWDVCANSIAIGQSKDMPSLQQKARRLVARSNTLPLVGLRPCFTTLPLSPLEPFIPSVGVRSLE